MQDQPPTEPAASSSQREPVAPARRNSSRKTLGLRPGDSLRRAGALFLTAQLDELQRHDDGVRQGDIDAVHDQRAASRRLQAGLALFERAFADNELRGLERPLRRLGRRLGAVRDTDVLLAETRSAGSDLAGVELNGFLARLEERRASGRVVLLEHLDSDGHRRWLSRFARLADADEDSEDGAGDSSAAVEMHGVSVRATLVRDLLPGLLWQRYGRVSAYAPVVLDATPETLHALRKAGRRFRYALEAFRELFPDNLGKLLRPLREMQDALGAMHDAHELVALLTDFEEHAGPSDRVQPLIVEERGRALEARAEFERVWPAIVAPAFRVGLAQQVALL